MRGPFFPNIDSKNALCDFPFHLYENGILDNPRVWINPIGQFEIGDGIDLKMRINEWVHADEVKLLEGDELMLQIAFSGVFGNPLFISEVRKIYPFNESSPYNIFQLKGLFEDEDVFWFEVFYLDDLETKLKIIRLAIHAVGLDKVRDQILLNLLHDPTLSLYGPDAWTKQLEGCELPNDLEKFVFVYSLGSYN